ncbi:phosphotransferase family protein [Ornithinimicrobium sp. Y1847]|uniref:phosphotransferase family protein n=1 Tax=unclassified Ornithinimicrobium TaxID=2615080 RepID=UPI003B66E773
MARSLTRSAESRHTDGFFMYGVRLTWADLPRDVHDAVAAMLGAPVVAAESQPGGFSPGSADRVRTADGTRAFVKAVSTQQNPDSPGLHRREGEVLAQLGTLTDAVPRLLGVHDDGDWLALVIEDVDGRHPRLPWERQELAAALEALAEIAQVEAPPEWNGLEVEIAGEMACWERVVAEPPEDLDPWARERLTDLVELAALTVPRLAGDRVAHTDVRADNLLVRPDGSVRVIDWPWATRGAPWADAAMLLLNVRWAGDLDVRPHLPALHALGAEPEDVVGLVAGLTGFLVDACRRPPSPGLPTLRAFQREQARGGLALLRELWPDG